MKQFGLLILKTVIGGGGVCGYFEATLKSEMLTYIIFDTWQGVAMPPLSLVITHSILCYSHQKMNIFTMMKIK